jgi:DNA repair photolyase
MNPSLGSKVIETSTKHTMNPPRKQIVADYWRAPAVIAPNNFIYKSLSNWAYNVAVGCAHACLFCYVPSVATIKQGPQLAPYGVDDPDEEWGNYVLLRPWDEGKFLASLRTAERTPLDRLRPDGNRAVIYCSTTDPYQVIRHPDPARRRELAEHNRLLVRRSLELVRDQSTLNVRILTRSPLARADFDLFRSFGDRLVFGMSVPTLRPNLSRVYEPRAPAPCQRLATLRAAKEAGLHVFVALAPTYPECDEADLRATLKAVSKLGPITIFHEPINIRAENVRRIAEHASSIGVSLNTEVFATRQQWQDYAITALRTVERLAGELGVADQLHLWPDKSLGGQAALARLAVTTGQEPDAVLQWLQRWWHRISEWPGQSARSDGGSDQMALQDGRGASHGVQQQGVTNATGLAENASAEGLAGMGATAS